MAFDLSSVLSKLQMLSTSDHTSVVSMNLFVALVCACIVIGHLLEENRWMNESITALLIVSATFSILCLPMHLFKETDFYTKYCYGSASLKSVHFAEATMDMYILHELSNNGCGLSFFLFTFYWIINEFHMDFRVFALV